MRQWLAALIEECDFEPPCPVNLKGISEPVTLHRAVRDSQG
jgi:hypothetical protein